MEAKGGDTIVFAPHITKIYLNSHITFWHFDAPLYIDGGGITISGVPNANNVYPRLFEVYGGFMEPNVYVRHLYISNITFENGRPALTSGFNGFMHATNCVFRDNIGAVTTSNGDFVAHNCTFYNNVTQTNGGAIAVNSIGFLAITNCTFYNNEAPLESYIQGGGGGGEDDKDRDSLGQGGGGGNPNLVRRGYGGAIYVNWYAGTGAS
jgi:hypothetical protein